MKYMKKKDVKKMKVIMKLNEKCHKDEEKGRRKRREREGGWSASSV